MNKRTRTVTAVCILLVLLLCGCGSSTANYKNSDGTWTKISYDSASLLERAPRFSEEDGIITMSFNGTEWYSVTVIDENEKERIECGEPIAESGNIKVYRNLSSGFGYCYVMDLENTDAAYVLIETDEMPGVSGYGSDYDYCISYSVDGVETVPDKEWK